MLLNNINEQSNMMMMILQDIKQLIDDIKELKPTIMCAVPRVLDRIYSGSILFLMCWRAF